MIVASLEHIEEHNKNGGMKMRTIKTLKDIELLKEASAVKGEILQEIEEHFKHIYKNIGEEDGITIEEFSLSKLVILPRNATCYLVVFSCLCRNIKINITIWK